MTKSRTADNRLRTKEAAKASKGCLKEILTARIVKVKSLRAAVRSISLDPFISVIPTGAGPQARASEAK